MSVIHISKTSVPGESSFANGGQRQGHATATTSESSIPGSPWKLMKGVTIKADAGNTSDLIIGTPGDSVNGFHLGANESVTLAIESSDMIRIVAASGTQSYSYLGV